MDEGLKIGDSFPAHDALKVSLARFAPHLKDVEKAVVIAVGVSSYQHMAALVQVGEDVVVKYGPYVNSAEQETLRFVSERTSVPVPQVHGVHEGDDGNTYIVMEFIVGTALDYVWDSLTTSQKDRITDQLRTHFRDLHALQGDFIGAVGKRPCKDIYFDDSADKGPFEFEERMNAGIVEAVRKTADFAEFCNLHIALATVRSCHRLLSWQSRRYSCHGGQQS